MLSGPFFGTLCCQLSVSQHFERLCCFHIQGQHFMKLHRLGPEDEGTTIRWNVKNYRLHGSMSHKPWILSIEFPAGQRTLLSKANKFPSRMHTTFGNLRVILDEYLTSTAPEMLLLTLYVTVLFGVHCREESILLHFAKISMKEQRIWRKESLCRVE